MVDTMKERSFKSVAKDAKRRLKSGFWEECEDELSRELARAREAGVSESRAAHYFTGKIALKLAGGDDEAFYARVRAMLRRKETYLPDLLTFGAVTLNRSTYQLLYQGRDQALSGKEFQLHEMMMQAPGSIIPTERFITHLWGWDTNVDTSVVWVHISNLRAKIEDNPAKPKYIKTVRGLGYKIENQ